MTAPPPPPVFILAAPFSGASYLAGQLAGHPQLFAVPELCLWMADRVSELLDIFELSQGPHADGLLRAVAQIEFGAQRDDTIERARGWLAQRRGLTTSELLGELSRRVAPRRLVVPDTEAPLRPIDLRRLRRHADGVRVLHLVRHPWEQGALLCAWARERLFVPPDFKDHAFIPRLVDPQIPWYRANSNLEALTARLPPAHAMRMTDEALDGDARAAMLAIARWLELSTGDAELDAMRDPDRWVFGGYGPGLAPYGLEAEVLEAFAPADLEVAARPTLRSPLPWRPDGSGFAPEVVDLARTYGYG